MIIDIWTVDCQKVFFKWMTKICVYYKGLPWHFQITGPGLQENQSSSRGCSNFEKEHLCLITLFKILSALPKLEYMCENSTKRRYRENQNQGVITANSGLPLEILRTLMHEKQCLIPIWAVTCDFQQCGTLTSVDSDKPVQTPLKLRNSKWFSVSSLTVIEYFIN